MAAKPFKEKELAAVEKGPGLGKEFKPEIKEKHEKEHKEQKDHKDQKDKPEKEKHEKEGKDFKDHKDKPEKDHHKEHFKEKELAKEIAKEKHEISETATTMATEMISPEAASVAGASIGKIVEHKFFKNEKHEIFEKFHKFEKPEKFEKHEKVEFEKLTRETGKEIAETPVITNPGDPIEQRLAAIENAVLRLSHFIPENLRPDLTQGALKNEPDVKKEEPAAPAHPDVKPEVKSEGDKGKK